MTTVDPLLRQPPSGHSLPFSKYQGLGNDFILLDWEFPELPTPTSIRFLCDRHFGVGADGLLLLLPNTLPSSSPTRLVVYNADGSRPEMCGNGLRCAAFHVALRQSSDPRRISLPFHTDAGVLIATVELPAQNPNEAAVTVDMGSVTLTTSVSLPDLGREILFVSVGNPHAVLFDPLSLTDLDTLARSISTHPRFSDGINVGFGQLTARGLQLRVWERGVGFTLACGTGACAAVAAAFDGGLLPNPSAIPVTLPGGILCVTLNPSDRRVSITGPAARVFSGSLPLPVIPQSVSPLASAPSEPASQRP